MQYVGSFGSTGISTTGTAANDEDSAGIKKLIFASRSAFLLII